MKKVLIYLLSLACCCANASGQPVAALQDLADLRAQAEQFLRTELGAADGLQIRASALDRTLKLAPCPAPVFTLADASAQIGGSVRVGIRCNAPQAWTLYTNATVQEAKTHEPSSKAPAAAAIKHLPTQAVALVKAGQSVTLQADGPGFRISSEGRALNHASAGQTVQVRTRSGQVVTGTAMAGDIVLLTP